MSISDVVIRKGTHLLCGDTRHSILATIALTSFGALIGAAGLSPNAAAQVAIKRTITEDQVVAKHSVLKRERPAAHTEVQRSAQTDSFNSDQGPGFGPRGPGAGCNVFPAPANIGTNVGLSYFGPPPSTINQSLVGPVQLLDSGQLDATKGTITLPLYLGYMAGTGKKVWYILTDVDDSNVAAELGLNFSAKMTFMSTAARTANFDDQDNLILMRAPLTFRPSAALFPALPEQNFLRCPRILEPLVTPTIAHMYEL